MQLLGKGSFPSVATTLSAVFPIEPPATVFAIDECPMTLGPWHREFRVARPDHADRNVFDWGSHSRNR